MSDFQHSIAGGNGNLVITSFQSPNFQAGVQGWQVTKDGDVEFNNGTFRGEIIASEFAAQIIVEAGPYAGTYTIQTGSFTDDAGNELAVIQWLNGTSPATVAPYIAGVSGPGAGNIASLHSGQRDSGDTDAAIWLESAEANDGSSSLVLLDCDSIQLFGDGGPLMVPDVGGAAVDFFVNGGGVLGIYPDGVICVQPATGWDPVNQVPETWHAITLDSGWSVPSGRAAPAYRVLADGNVQFAGAASRTSFTNTSVNLNGSNPLPGPYRPGSTKIYRGFSTSDAGQAAIEYNTTGVLTARAVGSGVTAGGNPNAEIDGIVSLL